MKISKNKNNHNNADKTDRKTLPVSTILSQEKGAIVDASGIARTDYSGSKAIQYSKDINYTGGPDQVITQKYLDCIPKDLTGMTVVDVGCGEGKLPKEVLSKRNPARLVGLDLSHEFIAMAASESIPGVLASLPLFFVIGDMSMMPVKNQSADILTSRFALHYSNNLSYLFKELARCLKPGGELIFLTNMTRGLYSNDIPDCVRKNFSIPIRLSKDVLVNNFAHSQTDYMKAMEMAGFEIVSMDRNNADQKIDDSYRFKEKIHLDAVIVKARKKTV